MSISSDYTKNIKSKIEKGIVNLDKRGVARWTKLSGRQPGSIAGGLHPLAGEALANNQILSSAGQITQQLEQLNQIGKMTEIFSAIGAGASVLNVGISVVGFAIMAKKLNQVNAKLDKLIIAIDELPEVIRESSQKLYNSLIEYDIHKTIDQISGSSQTIHYSLTIKSKKERQNILSPLVTLLSRDIAFLQTSFKRSIDAQNFELAFQLYIGHALALQMLVHAHVALGDSTYILQKTKIWHSQHLFFHESLARMLLGNTPGLINYADNNELTNIARGLFFDDPEEVAKSKVEQFRHQCTNESNLILITSTGHDILSPKILNIENNSILQKNFQKLATMTNISDIFCGNLEISHIKAKYSLANIESDENDQAIELYEAS